MKMSVMKKMTMMVSIKSNTIKNLQEARNFRKNLFFSPHSHFYFGSIVDDNACIGMFSYIG